MKIEWISFTLFLMLSACSTNYETNNELDNNMDVNEVTIMFYNTENLFDIYDDPLTKDDEFTPSGSKVWTEDRYQKKLYNIARVIDAIDTDDWPAIVGLCEVENKLVLEDLIQDNQIAHAGYGIVHYNSPDTRGIDMALLYRKSYMNIIDSRNISIRFPQNPTMLTRDILYAEVALFNGEHLHLFFNHWPSRREGEDETAFKRLHVASVLKEEMEAILTDEPDAKIVVMGDFNDYPDNKSIAKVLNAGDEDDDLFNLARKLDKEDKGTVNHRGDWGMIDQMMVSHNLMEENGWYVKDKKMQILYEDWLIYKDKKYGDFKPDKTYGGNTYYGGFSDHLPIYLTLKFKE